MSDSPLDKFLKEVAKDPFAKQALADTIAIGLFPVDGDNITFTREGVLWMQERERQLRIEAN